MAKWLANKVTEIHSKNELYRRISKSTGLPDFAVAHCLRTNPFKLPAILQAKHREEKQQVDVKGKQESRASDQPVPDEFAAMRAIASVIDKLDETTRKRVLKWAGDRAGITWN